jgi:hypothetical protein
MRRIIEETTTIEMEPERIRHDFIFDSTEANDSWKNYQDGKEIRTHPLADSQTRALPPRCIRTLYDMATKTSYRVRIQRIDTYKEAKKWLGSYNADDRCHFRDGSAPFTTVVILEIL